MTATSSVVYEIGDTIRVTATFKNASAAVTDPTTVTFRSKKNPGGTVTTLTYGVDGALVKSSTGIYYVDLSLDTIGIWTWKFKGSGVVGQSAVGTLICAPDGFD